jgi:hypothetical protein
VVITFPGEEYPPGKLIRWHGDTWTLVFDDELLRLPDTLGLNYLQPLLLHPGCRVAASRLIEIGHARRERMKLTARPALADEQVALLDTPVSDLGDAGQVLDDQAKRQYRAAIAKLDTELEEARRDCDVAIQKKLQEDKDFIRRQLSAAFGLRGRPRFAADASERNRKSVQKRIAETIRDLSRRNEALGRHLTASIKTGAYCRYSPPEPTVWNYQTFAEVCAASRRDAP